MVLSSKSYKIPLIIWKRLFLLLPLRQKYTHNTKKNIRNMDIFFSTLRIDWSMIIVVVYLLIKIFPKRHEGMKQTAYFKMLVFGLILMVFNLLTLCVKDGVFPYSPQVYFYLILCYFLALCLTTYGWFTYSEYVMESDWVKTAHRRFLIAIPLVVYYILCLTSQHTKLLFYLDEEGLYHRGLCGGLLQFLIPGIYLVALLIRVCLKLRNVQRADSFLRGVLFYPVVHAVAIILQIKYGHGYIAMASAASLLVAYIELHSIEEFKMEKAHSQTKALRRQYRLIDALSRDFEDVFLLNFTRGTSTTFKLHGKFVEAEKMRTYSYDEAYLSYIDSYVYSNDKSKVQSLFPIDVIRQKLKESPTFSFSYRVLYQGQIHHYQVKYSKVDTEADEEDLIIFGYQCIDDLVNMRRLSYTDRLTGLLNRHAFEENVHHLESKGLGKDLVIISADVNRLKYVNDTFGHSAGDELIQACANCLQQSFGRYGSVYRMGGDEFLAILETDENCLNAAIESFTKCTSSWHGPSDVKLSVSIGFASLRNNPQSTFKELMTLSDKLMYQDKTNYYKQRN